MRTSANILIVLGIALFVWIVTSVILLLKLVPLNFADSGSFLLVVALIPAIAASMVAAGILMRR